MPYPTELKPEPLNERWTQNSSAGQVVPMSLEGGMGIPLEGLDNHTEANLYPTDMGSDIDTRAGEINIVKIWNGLMTR